MNRNTIFFCSSCNNDWKALFLGYISRTNLAGAFKKTGRKFTDKEIDEILIAEGKPIDGVFDKSEFKQMMLNIVEH